MDETAESSDYKLVTEDEVEASHRSKIAQQLSNFGTRMSAQDITPETPESPTILSDIKNNFGDEMEILTGGSKDRFSPSSAFLKEKAKMLKGKWK